MFALSYGSCLLDSAVTGLFRERVLAKQRSCWEDRRQELSILKAASEVGKPIPRSERVKFVHANAAFHEFIG